ncbi:MAG: cupin domain-containing protein [Balneolaceae bacterium]
MSKSKVIKNENFSWKGVERKEYKTETSNFKDIHRYSLLGDETSDLNIHTRYFEVQPDGYSSLEQHRHPHSVVIIRGSGSVILDNEIISLNLHDVVYVAPETIHQFHADNNEPLGFLCMVDRYRDKPVIPDEKTLTTRIQSEKVLKKIRK